jgi:hypothetical protein
MSTVAPLSAAHELPLTRETRNVRVRGAPALTVPFVGSDRMSLRFSFSSTKYGPSVTAGRTMHDGSVVVAADAAAAVVAEVLVGCDDVVGVGDASAPGAHAARRAAPDPPRRARTSLRLRMRPIGRSSSSISVRARIVA